MPSLLKKLAIAVYVLTALAVSAVASTPEPPAVPRDYVVDLAGIIDDSREAQLNGYLQELEQKTTAQVLVLTVQSLEGESIEQFSLNTKEKWKLGQKGRDNGVLIVVAVKDRRYRIEVGYGLESVLPDSMVGTIGREYFVPYFRAGDYGGGIYAAVTAVASQIAAQEGVQITGLQRMRPAPGAYATRRPISKIQMIAFAVFGIIALILFITHPHQCLLLILASQMGGRGGWSGGGGGFGGGSFGGGGGGSGGGGGASGGW